MKNFIKYQNHQGKKIYRCTKYTLTTDDVVVVLQNVQISITITYKWKKLMSALHCDKIVQRVMLRLRIMNMPPSNLRWEHDVTWTLPCFVPTARWVPGCAHPTEQTSSSPPKSHSLVTCIAQKKTHSHSTFNCQKRKPFKNATVAHLISACIQQVGSIPQSNSKNILWRPIQQVPVEVILHCRRIQNLQKKHQKITTF